MEQILDMMLAYSFEKDSDDMFHNFARQSLGQNSCDMTSDSAKFCVGMTST